MGMLDGILGSVLGGMAGGTGQQQNPLMQIALQLLQQNGGVGGVLDKFRQAGYADQADSWQSTGQNMPISGPALQEVLGSGADRPDRAAARAVARRGGRRARAGAAAAHRQADAAAARSPTTTTTWCAGARDADEVEDGLSARWTQRTRVVRIVALQFRGPGWRSRFTAVTPI